jgi:hypothetical protein
MPLRSRQPDEDVTVRAARRKVDLALLEMTEILDKVQEQVAQAKEELGEGRAG